MRSSSILALVVIIAATGVACSSAPAPSEVTATAQSADNTCNPACTAPWTSCQQEWFRHQHYDLVCLGCGTEGGVPCDDTGPNPGCQTAPPGSVSPYMGSVDGVCEPCGQHVGETACNVPGTGFCAPWDISTDTSSTPMQPLMPSNGVCVACGNDGQQECDVGGTEWCEVGVSSNGQCYECVVGSESLFCPAYYCNDGSCLPGLITSCPIAGGPASAIQCGSPCGNHKGVSTTIGCSIE
jgi:hypothetical protein